MTGREKLRRKPRNNPKDATMREVETLLTYFGFTLARIKGSHHIYEYVTGNVFRQITVPLHGRKVKKLYVKNVAALLDELFPDITEEMNEENDDQNIARLPRFAIYPRNHAR